MFFGSVRQPHKPMNFPPGVGWQVRLTDDMIFLGCILSEFRADSHRENHLAIEAA